MEKNNAKETAKHVAEHAVEHVVSHTVGHAVGLGSAASGIIGGLFSSTELGRGSDRSPAEEKAISDHINQVNNSKK
jgi:homoserine kinase